MNSAPDFEQLAWVGTAGRILELHHGEFCLPKPDLFLYADGAVIFAHPIRGFGKRKALASMLLATLIALTCVPVCGSPMDVDPAGCCRRQGCAHSANAPSTTVGRASCCHKSSNGLTSADQSQQCCNQGRLTYPTAQVQAAWSATSLIGAAYVLAAAPRSMVVNGDLEPARPIHEFPPGFPDIPLYKLNSTLRI